MPFDRKKNIKRIRPWSALFMRWLHLSVNIIDDEHGNLFYVFVCNWWWDTNRHSIFKYSFVKNQIIHISTLDLKITYILLSRFISTRPSKMWKCVFRTKLHTIITVYSWCHIWHIFEHILGHILMHSINCIWFFVCIQLM